MDRLIRVRDLDERRVFLDLRSVLTVFNPDGHAWTWSLQIVPDLWAEEGWDFNHEAMEQQIQADHRGLRMGFEELVRFGDRIGQVIWGEFLAGQAPDALPRREDDAPSVGHAAIAGLAAIDSTYWLLGGPAGVVQRATERFKHVEELSPDEWIRGEE